MIIFDLDDVLANCEHRRHFVDPEKNENYCRYNGDDFRRYENGLINLDIKWKPDWDAFHEACDKDRPIWKVIKILQILQRNPTTDDIYIWSVRSESVRNKTRKWIHLNLDPALYWDWDLRLKMRPIGDTTPGEQLKEKWLDERIDDMGNQAVSDIEYVFDSHGPSIEMWRRRGIFVFDCNQREGSFN